MTILKPLKTVTTMMCSQKHPTVSLIHTLKEMLLQHLEVLPTDNTLVSDVKNAIKSDLKPRYTDESILGFLLRASALDPRFKSLPYLDEGARCDVYESIQKEVETACISSQNVTVKAEPAEHTNNTPTEDALPLLPQLPNLPTLEEGQDEPELVEPELVEPPAKIKKEKLENVSSGCQSNSALSDLFGDVFVTKVEPAKSFLERILSELISYKEEDCLPLDSDVSAESGVSNPLLWWKDRETKYPLLSKYAKQLLGIPATSVASERVFSTAGDVVTAQRACLSGDQVDMLVFLKHNIIIPDDIL